MFARRTDASKVALVTFCKLLREKQIGLIDCQVRTEHLFSLGAREIPRAEFLRRLRDALRYPDERGKWSWQSAKSGRNQSPQKE
jgi:leucyl/phenylalanyl-tRNA--protein transferase